jgi:hypothetical protein
VGQRELRGQGRRAGGSRCCLWHGGGRRSAARRGAARGAHRPPAPPQPRLPPLNLPARLLAEPLHASFTPEFLATLMSNAELVRHVAVVGALHHGKTTVMDMLVEQVGEGAWGCGGGEGPGLHHGKTTVMDMLVEQVGGGGRGGRGTGGGVL